MHPILDYFVTQIQQNARSFRLMDPDVSEPSVSIWHGRSSTIGSRPAFRKAQAHVPEQPPVLLLCRHDAHGLGLGGSRDVHTEMSEDELP